MSRVFACLMSKGTEFHDLAAEQEKTIHNGGNKKYPSDDIRNLGFVLLLV